MKRFYRHALSRVFGVTPDTINDWADKGRLVPTTDDLGRRCWTITSIRNFIARYRDREGEPKMWRIQAAIFKTYQVAPHAFEYGCGRDTMAYWVSWATGDDYGAGRIRRHLLRLVDEGLFEHGMSGCDYHTFRWIQETDE